MSDLSGAPVPPAPTREDRAAILVWLAGFFAAPPTAATIAAHRRGAGAALLAELAEDALLGPGAQRMRAALAADVDDDALAARLERVFGLLLLGIGGPETAAPYESVHRDGRMFGEATGEMNRLLADHDLSVALSGEPADHLSIEAALLARLVETGHPDRAPLAARLAAWTPDFAARLAVRDPSGLWAGAAHALAAAAGREHALHPLETRD